MARFDGGAEVRQILSTCSTALRQRARKLEPAAQAGPAAPVMTRMTGQEA